MFDVSQLSVSANDRALLKEFVSSWGRHRYPVLFAGAGLSKNAKPRPDRAVESGFSSWNQLLDDMKLRLSGGDKSLVGQLSSDALRLAEIFERQFGRPALFDIVLKHVPNEDYVPGEVHELLAQLPWAAVVTTNYDDLIERAFERRRTVRRVISDQDLTQQRSLDDLLIVKLHGDLSVRDSIVLTEEDYRSYSSRRPGLSIKVRQLLTEHPLLFVGFSLADPHFVMIDGWIRDTVRHLRLPAIAIMRDEGVPAERAMWKSRGIELIALGQESLPRLLTAVVEERRREYGIPARTDTRVIELEQQALQIAQEGRSDGAERLARCLVKIVEGAAADGDGGREAGRAIRQWNATLSMVSVMQPQRAISPAHQPLTMAEVLPHLRETELRDLWMLALQTGSEALYASRDHSIDALSALEQLSPTPEERARALLYRARIYRSMGDTPKARSLIASARMLHPSPRTLGELSIELREVAFQEGDKASIESELRRTLDEGADTFARCRRGADMLLLQKRDDAASWYHDALERAKTGDEQYAALWGRYAAQYTPWSSDAESNLREAEFRHKTSSILESERPRAAAAERLVDIAGRNMLRGDSVEAATQKLREFLDEARRMGWPHGLPRIAFEVDQAAAYLGRLLLSDEVHTEDRREAIKEGLAVLRRFGLATETAKLFTGDMCDLLARQSADVDWFRQFYSVTPSLDGPARARITVGLRGLSLLTDSQIHQIIETVVTQTQQWLNNADSLGDAGQIGAWWSMVAEHDRHLPKESVHVMMGVLSGALGDRRVAFRIAPSRFNFQGWLQLGHIARSGPEAGALVQAGVNALPSLATSRDPHGLREIVGCLAAAGASDLWDSKQRESVATAGLTLLDAILETNDDYAALRVAALVSHVDSPPYHRLKSFASHALRLVEANMRSSELATALWCAAKSVEFLSSADRERLVNLALQASGDGSAWEQHGAIAGLGVVLEAVGDVSKAHTDVATKLLGLAEKHSSLLRTMCVLFPSDGPQAAELAGRHLSRPDDVELARSIAGIQRWLMLVPGEPFTRAVIERLLSYADVASRDVRRVALVALKGGLSKSEPSFEPLRQAARDIAVRAARDPSWQLRCTALVAAHALCRTQQELDEVRSMTRADAPIALERRLSEFVRTREPATSSALAS